MRKLRIRIAAAAAAGAVVALTVGVGAASAHVTVNPREAVQGGYAKLAFRVPNEKDAASTTKLEVYVPTDVLAVRLADLLAAERPDRAIRVVEELDGSWWDAYQQSRPNTADPATLRMILDGNPPRAFASAIEVGEDVPFAIARGHLSGDWLGTASIWTREDRRRQGWATAMLKALGHWAARRGARYGYLQVASASAHAIAAYQRLGFIHHHSYHYLGPSAGQDGGAAEQC